MTASMIESDWQDFPASRALLEDPREGEGTEHIEKGGGKVDALVPLHSASGPRDGEKTEPVEEGDK